MISHLKLSLWATSHTQRRSCLRRDQRAGRTACHRLVLGNEPSIEGTGSYGVALRAHGPLPPPSPLATQARRRCSCMVA